MAEEERAKEAPLPSGCNVLTIDTNVFSHAGYGIESGLLAQLEQFKDGDVELVFSDIVRQEIRSQSHLPRKIREARAELQKALRNSSRELLISEKQAKQAQALLANAKSDQQIADERLGAFMDRCGALIIGSSSVALKEVTDMYFASKPPFEEAGEKKAEFPDAIALLSLERWAQARGKKILAVSHDKGWKAFCETSAFLEHTSDLSKALAYFQPDRWADQLSRELDEAILLGRDVNGVLEAIAVRIKNHVENMEVDVEATSRFYYEPDDVHARYEGHEFVALAKDHAELDVVRVSDDTVVVRLVAHIRCHVHASFSLSMTDPIDKDVVNMGSQDFEREESFNSDILVTFEGDISKGLSGVGVGDVEVEDGLPTVDFGEIELDYGPDDDDPR